MSPLVFALVVGSASLHVLWNGLVKSCDDKASFIWLTSVVGCLLLLPVLIVHELFSVQGVCAAAVGWAALSGFFEALYAILLFSAYRYGDLSVVYPLSRGMAPIVLMMLGGVLLGDSVSAGSAAAVAVVVSGVVMVALSGKPTDEWLECLRSPELLLSLATGCMIAGYHLVDRRAMTMAAAPSAWIYLCLMHLFLAVYVSAWCWLLLRRGRSLFSEWRNNRQGVMIVGICTPAAYLLIMIALRFGNVTFIAAGRNIGIFLSTAAGAVFLKEPVGRWRFLGAVLIVLGVMGLVVV